jgi:hypothetical protein
MSWEHGNVYWKHIDTVTLSSEFPLAESQELPSICLVHLSALSSALSYPNRIIQ